MKRSLFVLLLSIFAQSSVGRSESLSLLLKTPERDLLGPRFEGRLVPVEFDETVNRPKNTSLVLVHGMSGSIQNFSKLLSSDSEILEYPLFYFAYDDLYRSLSVSARELAADLRKLSSPRVVVLAHSMGGIVARAALDILAKDPTAINFRELHLIAVDTPWHGGSEGSCRTKGSRWDRLVEMFLPAAIVDMRACSDFLNKFSVKTWPASFSMDLYFAEQGEQARDYSELPLLEMPEKIRQYILSGEPVRGSLSERNFWCALQQSSQFKDFAQSLRRAGAPPLLEVRQALEVYFPRLPGDHVTVLDPHSQQKTDLLRALTRTLLSE